MKDYAGAGWSRSLLGDRRESRVASDGASCDALPFPYVSYFPLAREKGLFTNTPPASGT